MAKRYADVPWLHHGNRAHRRGVFQTAAHPYTQFLLSAVLDTDVDSTSHRMLLQGEIPSPIDAPAGCRFCTRCPYASDECRTVAPALREVESGHQVACHRVAQEKCPACP